MEEIKIQAPKWKLYLAVFGIIVFVIIGIFMLFGDTSLFEKLAGILAIVFFGGFGGMAMYSTLVRGTGNILISPVCLKLSFPGCPTIPINWSDIEDFGTYQISGQRFTTIKLNHYGNLMNSIHPDDAAQFVKKFRSMRIMGYATAVVGVLHLENIKELLAVMPKSSELKDFAAFLNYSRNRFGGEFLIGWNMRDRNAVRFAEFLRDKKINYT